MGPINMNMFDRGLLNVILQHKSEMTEWKSCDFKAQ